jgi:hypothetical protein
MNTLWRCTLTLLLACALAGCGKKSTSSPMTGRSTAHAHAAPHGGTLVEVGDHQFNLELMLDPAAGKLTVWLLDAHATNFVRSAQPVLVLSVPAAGGPRTLTLLPVANPATGETVGDTSQFEAAADWLVGANRLAGEFHRIDFRGAVFTGLKFEAAPPGADHDHSGHAH